jgi:hypothetical protein
MLAPQQVQALWANKREQEEQLEEMNQPKDEHDPFLAHRSGNRALVLTPFTGSGGLVTPEEVRRCRSKKSMG